MDALSSLRAHDATAVYPAAQVRAPGVKPQGIEEITVTGQAPEESFSFLDFLDVINPLQHIPIVNTIYREMTGDTIKAPAKMVGAAILGGPIGLAAAMIDTAIEGSTGKDLGGHAMALLKDEKAAPTAVADTAAPSGTAEEIPAAAVAAAVTPSPAAASSLAAAAQKYAPTATEAQIAAAQIAAKANVFAPLKRDVNPYASPMARTAESREVERQALLAKTRHAVFMPINRSATGGRDMIPAQRQTQENISVDELRATTKFAPGALSVAGGALPPAAVAAASKARREDAQAAIDGTRTPVNVPAWFDDAMMKTMDKYESMKAPASG